MSESNGKPQISPYRRAVERHRAERAAWRAVQAAQRLLRAALLNYDTLCIVGQSAADAFEALPGGLVELPESETLLPTELAGIRTDAEAAELPPWTSEDLERELLHALGCGGLNAYSGWGPLITGGATDQEIGEKLDAIWPQTRRFTKSGDRPEAGLYDRLWNKSALLLAR